MRETSESACILLAKSCIQIPILSTCPHAHVIVAPVVKTGGFCVRVPGHLLRDFDAPAVGEIVGDAGARKLWQPIAVSIPASETRRRTMHQTSLRVIGDAVSFLVLRMAERNSHPLRSSSMPAA